MELIPVDDLLKSRPLLAKSGGAGFLRLVMRLLSFNKVNDFYRERFDMPPGQFLDELIGQTGIHIRISTEDLAHIPPSGPFITVSNHAYGAIDGLLLARLIGDVNPDYRLLVNFLLTRIRPLQPFFLGVNPFESHREVQSSLGGLREAYLHLEKGNPLGLFPAGEVSSFRFSDMRVTDREWQPTMMKFISRARIPIIPVYFSGHNSLLFNILGLIHPMLRTLRLPAELFNKQGCEITVRIGSPLTVKEQDDLGDLAGLGKFLRMKTYSLSTSLKSARGKKSFYSFHQAPIPGPAEPSSLSVEIGNLTPSRRLFTIREYSVFNAPSGEIPLVMREIGRLREITYREAGEGTGKPLDTDPFDEFFEQLFIWDSDAERIVGGYRVGRGREIIGTRGIKGHYISSLFRIDPAFEPLLRMSLELGRSFIVKDYQKKTLPLFLLWKGILYLLLKAPEYRYLIGPVSIPNDFAEESKSLVVSFMKAGRNQKEYASYIRPRHPFRPRFGPETDAGIFLRYTGNDMARLDRYIHDLDPRFKLPVLLKKYLAVNSEVLGFNVDPEFSGCLDLLVILDLHKVPFDMIEGLSKEINDQSILERFRKP